MDHSLACLAYKSVRDDDIECNNIKGLFEEQFKDANWEIPRIVEAMKNSNDCYFDTIAQVRMTNWSKGCVVLVGDAAHAASGIGTSMAMVGAYVLAREIKQADGDYTIAYAKYETAIREFVDQGQNLAESNLDILVKSRSSWLIKCQLYLMKVLPGKFIRFITEIGRKRMRIAANSIVLEECNEKNS
jgi:2-polyprenyl-6-methoxyphenol hydroxylase-like FAD-dependent oxidoreductase